MARSVHFRDGLPPVDLERSILQVLCSAKLTRSDWNKITRALRKYAWQAVEHELVYAAIGRVGYQPPRGLLEQLPAQTTRMGFPDIDWHSYFSSEPRSAAAPTVHRILSEIDRLTQASHTPASAHREPTPRDRPS